MRQSKVYSLISKVSTDFIKWLNSPYLGGHEPKLEKKFQQINLALLICVAKLNFHFMFMQKPVAATSD